MRLIACLLLLATVAAPGLAIAQGSGASWVALDSQPPGTPAQVILNADLSDPTQTFLDVSISGFYLTTRVGDDGRIYQDVRIPGLPSFAAPGEPRVPIVRVELGIVTGAAQATLASVTSFDTRVLSGYLVWPSPIPSLIHDGTPEQFVRDEATYASSVDFPPGDGLGGTTRTALAGIPASLCTAYPVHWNPASGVLTVAAHARFGFAHGGSLGTPLQLTREHAGMASNALFNWGSIGSNVSVDWTHFNGCYLFMCPSAWLPQLQPLVNEKKARGFSVSVVNVSLIGESCSQMQQAIQGWYAGTPAGADHYCLLVGSFNLSSLCFFSGQLTDKLLSSVDGDTEPEIYFGRLWVADTTMLKNQVQKILDYETQPQVNNDGNVLLVAHHQQNQTYDFEAGQEVVRTASYAQVTPGFITCYGTNPALGNGDIKNDIETGVGLADYFGHGEPNRWDQWTAASASYTQADALALANGAKTPVVWSIACSTGNYRDASCLGAAFMRNSGGGAVAFYGGVDVIWTTDSQVLNETLFQSVYGKGITRHGQAIVLAEHAVIVSDSLFGFDEDRKLVLFGDPEMDIKRHNPGGVWLPLDIVAPATLITPCPGPGCCPTCAMPIVDIQVREASGAPKPDVKVGVWKSAPGGADELFDNGYTGPDGWVHIPAPMITPGELHYGWDDGDGRSGMGSLEVQSTAGVDGRPGGPLALRAIPSVTSGSTRFAIGRALDQGGRVTIFSVDGRRVRVLDVPEGASSVTWDGDDAESRPVAPGAYEVRLEAGALHASGRVVVVR